MKKSTKITLAMAGIFAVAGIGLSLAGMVLGAGDVIMGFAKAEIAKKNPTTTSLPGTVQESDAEYRFEGIENLDIDAGAAQMWIRTYEGERCLVDVNGKTRKLTCEKDGDTLDIEVKRADNITLWIPQDASFGEANLEVGAGTLEAEGMEVRELSLNCGVGSMTYEGKVTGEADLECGIGEVTMNLHQPESLFGYKLSCGIGNIDYGSQSHTGIIKDSYREEEDIPQLDIECGIGNVTVAFVS